MKIEMGKKYRTRDGRPVRILAMDIRAPRTIVIAVMNPEGDESLHTVYPDGNCSAIVGEQTSTDLMEVSPYDDFKINDPVMAKISSEDENWQRRYFAGVGKSGHPLVFPNGRTRWSSHGCEVSAFEVRRPTEEELK